jgi:hypothetical protein
MKAVGPVDVLRPMKPFGIVPNLRGATDLARMVQLIDRRLDDGW